MSIILGLDLGPNSIGWSLIDPDNSEIIGTGVRIFQEGLNRQGGKEESKNATRRTARQSRRMNARRNARRNKLVYILQEAGILPETKAELNELMKLSPYPIRAKGLDEKLSLYDFGRALYHINQRRGFKSNRKTDSTNENSKIYQGKENVLGINETIEEIKKGRYRTLGEYLNNLDPHKKRQRNRYTERVMYINEFNKLWDKQAEYYAEIADPELKKDVFDAIFFQRRLKSQKKTVKQCTFEPKKKVAPKSSPTYQYFRILEQLSRIRITDGERFKAPLTQEEHQLLVNELMNREKMKLEKIAKKLKLSDSFHINLESQNNIKGHTTYSNLAKVFGKKEWASFSEDKKHEIWHTLHFYNDPPENPDWLKDHAKKKWDLNDEKIEKLHKVSLEAGYGQLSHKALTNIIPYLEKFDDDETPTTYDKAVLEVYKHHSKISKYDGTRQRLPQPENLRNPLVQQSLFELKNVVNAIIKKYEKPDIIRVELARDTKLPKWKRKAMVTLNKRRNEEAEKIKDTLKTEYNFSSPGRDDVIKYKLWEECNRTCPFTGKKISIAELFSNQYQIEHIIPYSRSLDDSQANKTLCYWKENQTKHNRTPFEAYGHDEKRYEEILDRVSKFHKVDRIIRVSPEWGKIINGRNYKINKFKQKKVEDDFVQRQLVDTAYISKEVAKYLEAICKKVYVTSGRTTSTLRHYWGLNDILSGDVDIKQREDHRHHAIDALVIANTTHGFVNTMSRYHKYDREPNADSFTMPWDSFHKDAEKAVNNILISHKVNNRARGQLHEETNYGRITLPDGSESFVVRKPIESLTANQLQHIVDKQVKQNLFDRLCTFGINIEDKFKIPKEAWNDPLYLMGSKNPIKKVRITVPTQDMLQLYEDKKLFVEYGKNHHMEIFEHKNGKRIGRTVSMYDAVQRKKKNKPIINETPTNENYRFVMSLAINELLLLDVEKDKIDWDKPLPNQALSTQLFRLQKMDVNGVLTFRHHTVSITNDDTGRIIKNSNTLKGIKVNINSLGFITPAYNETP